MLSVLVLALCLLIPGGISEDEAGGTSDGESEDTTFTTLLSGPVFNYSETNPELQNYQDAWKFVTSNESFLMTYRNFNTNPTGESTTNCVTATMIYKDETTHSVLHNVTYLNTTINVTISFNKSYDVISSECYTTRNVLNGTVAFTNESELYPFAFADKNCAVIRKDSWSNETFKACELWVFKSALEKDLSCCDFVFDLLCTRGYKQKTYDPELCKPKDTEVNADTGGLTSSKQSSK
uniref:Putative secreted salivary gland peptide n=1 Tax=Ixodes scapularis TaxID=6945 RepID=Q5Q988_IXOSC|nr:putative secreted salivary gland peptide [Ixodes scapularis]